MKQSFNVDNFIKIYYDENRKGDYLDGRFPEFINLKHYGNSIKEINKKFRDGFYSTPEQKERANKRKERLQQRKFDNLQVILLSVEEKIDKKNYHISMITKTIKAKTAYTIDRSNIETFFLFKQIQKNIQHSFKVKQADRNEIISQVVNMLDNGFPKYIIRTDIKSFYESIPHDELKKVISRNHILSPLSKKVINEILRQYKSITGHDEGIPRGIGISAYLAELYMRDFDNDVKNLKNVTYYARYVDDIIIIFTPNNKYESVDYLSLIEQCIVKTKLNLNEKKTEEINFLNMKSYKLEFLGYQINFNYIRKLEYGLNINLSHKKIRKYQKKIQSMINNYNISSKMNEREARKLMLQRLRYLTGNTRLLGVKKDILIGSYFSNQKLFKTNSLIKLDEYLYAKLDKHLKPYIKLTMDLNQLKSKLKILSFENGFEKKKFYKFSKKDLEKILSIWKSL